MEPTKDDNGRPKILIAEDDSSLAGVWAEFLRDQNYEVTVVGNAPDAVDALVAEKFSLLISDIYFRRDGVIEKDGGVTLINRVRLENIKSPDQTRRLPIIAVTGSAGTQGTFRFNAIQTVGSIIEAGLQKPIRLEALLQAVQQAIEPAKTEAG